MNNNTLSDHHFYD
jgi:hypothetical protein